MSTHFTLGVGDAAAIRRRFFRRSWSVVYAGMPDDRSYSLAVNWSLNYNSAAYNLFLPADQRELRFLDGRIVVEDLSPREIRFRYEN